LIKYKNEIHDPDLPKVAIENLSLKFLQFIWESTCTIENIPKTNFNISKTLLNKSKSSSNNSINNKRKSILVIPSYKSSNFNLGKHFFKISDLIVEFCKKKNYDAIKY